MDELSWLFGLQRFGVRPGLERVGRLLSALGDPQAGLRVALVGGTNGKGSTACALAAALTASGRRAALFTSPHLSHVMERFRLDGRPLPREGLEAVLAELRPAVERWDATFFEALVAAAALLFARAGAEDAVFEVGLGGRFDATNALDPALSIVTGVALDHTEVLGGTVAEIARDKADIFRAGRPALTGAEGEALRELRAAAAGLGAPLAVLGEGIRAEATQLGWRGQRLHLATPWGRLTAHSPLVGAHQARNLALGAAAALALGAPPAAVRSGLARARWPGRLERFETGDRAVVFDGAHNPEAARALAAALWALGERPVLVVGVSGDKDLAGIAAELAPAVGHVIATTAERSARARPAREVAAAFAEAGTAGPERGGWGVEVVERPADALRAGLEAAPPGGTVLVAGSLYLVGELRPALTGEEREPFERWQ